MKSSSGYEIYHNTLYGCLNEIENYVISKGYTIGDYFPEINHVSYGTTERTQLEMLKDGRIANTLEIQIYRMENGKYELNCYPVRKFALGGGINSYKVGDKFKYNYDNKTYQVLEIADKKITLSPDLSSYWNNKEVTISLMNKWIEDKIMVKIMAKGGGTQTYKDLSKETPMVVNDSATKVGKVPEIDIIKTGNTFDAPPINNSEKSVQIFMKFWNENNIEIVEQMNVMFLNKANKPIGIYQHSKGGIDGTILDIEIISAMAVKSLAKAVIIAHNHPSGNTRPSDADKKMTRQLSNALELFKISLLDSLIITKETYFSFADEGLMN